MTRRSDVIKEPLEITVTVNNSLSRLAQASESMKGTIHLKSDYMSGQL